MRQLIKSISGGQKGFTLIELLVVIAILGVIAAIVALNVAGFFGRGTLQAANTELHQAQTAIIAAMADAESNVVGNFTGDVFNRLEEPNTITWSGGAGSVVISGPGGYFDATEYIFGPFRARYTVDHTGAIIDGDCELVGEWGTGIQWSTTYLNWEKA